jgi:hypothetical protein
MVAARLGRDLLQWSEPMFFSPLRGIRRIDGDHRETAVSRHLDQSVAKLCCGQSTDQAAERSTTLAAAWPTARMLPTSFAALCEVEIFDDDRPTTIHRGRRDEIGDRLA